MKHEKLQQILAETLENEPYNEICILLFNLDEPTLFAIAGPMFKNARAINNFEYIDKFISNDWLSKKEATCIMEAYLIKYFSPPHNILLKKSSTTFSEKFLQKCRKYDINSIRIDIDMRGNNIKLFSSTKEANYRHYEDFSIYQDENRISIKNIFLNIFRKVSQ